MGESIQGPGLRLYFDGIVSSEGRADAPPPRICQHCGAKLYWRGLSIGGVVSDWPFPSPCNCKVAAEERALRKKVREKEKKAREDARRIERINQLIKNSGMGARFQKRTFDTFTANTKKQADCLRQCRAYAEEFYKHLEDGTGLFMAGSVGTGKTHLAAAIALQLMGRGTPVIFRPVVDMLQDIRRAYSGEVSETEILSVYKTVPLLVLDDLGKEKASEWAAATLYSIVNARYEALKPMIVTTNFDTDGLIEQLGERTRAQAILSRLMETSIYLPMAWADQRTGGSA